MPSLLEWGQVLKRLQAEALFDAQIQHYHSLYQSANRHGELPFQELNIFPLISFAFSPKSSQFITNSLLVKSKQMRFPSSSIASGQSQK